MKCPKCNAENPDTKQFCGDCGAPLGQDILEVTRTIETPAQELTRGTVFADRYEIIEQLGIGGMGAVYRVEDMKVKEEIAPESRSSQVELFMYFTPLFVIKPVHY